MCPMCRGMPVPCVVLIPAAEGYVRPPRSIGLSLIGGYRASLPAGQPADATTLSAAA
jgi:hypothetical protein